ncbi:MAG: cytochrome C oxidase subunit IV family protein [Planctomycetes bacterium]|nr:cytochrome C oxidase subunit IV family protein [Planctomycetota bacterium]
MSDNPKIARLEARINEITSRPTYSSTPAWRQEVAELRLQIEGIRSGREVVRKEYQRAEVGTPAMAGAHGAELTGSLDDEGQGDEIDRELHAEHHAPYTAIWLVLLVMTLLEWKLAAWFHVEGIPLWSILLVLAVVKALLVAVYFMHLKFERRTMYALLCLPVFLVVVMFFLVSPDAQQQAWHWIFIGRR